MKNARGDEGWRLKARGWVGCWRNRRLWTDCLVTEWPLSQGNKVLLETVQSLLSPHETISAFFWDYSGIGLLGIDGIRVLLGGPFSAWTEYHSIHYFVHSAPDSRIKNGIRFTWNTQNTRFFGKFLAGKPTRPPAPIAWLPVGRRSRSQVTSAMTEYSVFRTNERFFFGNWNSVYSVQFFLNRNKNSRIVPKECTQCINSRPTSTTLLSLNSLSLSLSFRPGTPVLYTNRVFSV